MSALLTDFDGLLRYLGNKEGPGDLALDRVHFVIPTEAGIQAPVIPGDAGFLGHDDPVGYTILGRV